MVLTGALVIAKPPPPRTCQRVVIASSAEKFGMLRDFAATYNRTTGSAVGLGLAGFALPALFIVILGPAALILMKPS